VKAAAGSRLQRQGSGEGAVAAGGAAGSAACTAAGSAQACYVLQATAAGEGRRYRVAAYAGGNSKMRGGTRTAAGRQAVAGRPRQRGAWQAAGMCSRTCCNAAEMCAAR